MAGILAIDTATDACSVATHIHGETRERFEVIPRGHSARLFSMLQSLLPNGQLQEHGIEALAYSCGPGSFTGLRVGASAIQGLAYSNALPTVAVSTLALQAQTALRLGLVTSDDVILSMIDARVNEIYTAQVRFLDGLATVELGPTACAPEDVALEDSTDWHAIGSGARFVSRLPKAIRDKVRAQHSDLLPAARDLIPLARYALTKGETQSPQQIQPLYVRDEIGWKKLAEQGKAE